jgi:hypothetical protein
MPNKVSPDAAQVQSAVSVQIGRRRKRSSRTLVLSPITFDVRGFAADCGTGGRGRAFRLLVQTSRDRSSIGFHLRNLFRMIIEIDLALSRLKQGFDSPRGARIQQLRIPADKPSNICLSERNSVIRSEGASAGAKRAWQGCSGRLDARAAPRNAQSHCFSRRRKTPSWRRVDASSMKRRRDGYASSAGGSEASISAIALATAGGGPVLGSLDLIFLLLIESRTA